MEVGLRRPDKAGATAVAGGRARRIYKEKKELKYLKMKKKKRLYSAVLTIFKFYIFLLSLI
jgi:hypothetical protein